MAMRAGQRGERDPHRAVSMSKRFRHGHARLGKKTATYRAWATMHDRCYNPHYHRFHRYGGRSGRMSKPQT